jgi:hypothetical protein
MVTSFSLRVDDLCADYTKRTALAPDVDERPGARAEERRYGMDSISTLPYVSDRLYTRWNV